MSDKEPFPFSSKSSNKREKALRLGPKGHLKSSAFAKGRKGEEQIVEKPKDSFSTWEVARSSLLKKTSGDEKPKQEAIPEKKQADKHQETVAVSREEFFDSKKGEDTVAVPPEEFFDNDRVPPKGFSIQTKSNRRKRIQHT